MRTPRRITLLHHTWFIYRILRSNVSLLLGHNVVPMIRYANQSELNLSPYVRSYHNNNMKHVDLALELGICKTEMLSQCCCVMGLKVAIIRRKFLLRSAENVNLATKLSSSLMKMFTTAR